MEHDSNEVSAGHNTHAHHEQHEHHEHQMHREDKNVKMLFAGAFVVGILLVIITAFLGNFLYTFAVVGALIILIPLYYKKYLTATIVAAIIIAIITIAYRLSLLHYYGFYEPDGFYHYAVIRAAVLHGFVVPHFLSISGFPASAPVTEPIGLYWITLIPYAFLQFFGVTYYTIERLIPVAYAVGDLIGTYFLIKEFNKDRMFALLGMLFVGLSMGDAARTSATVYRGDGFVTLFVIIALIFLIKTFKAQTKNKTLLYALLSGFVLSIANIVWNGASFGIAIYILGMVLILLYAFLTEKIETIMRSRYLLIALAFWYLLANVYQALNLIGGQNEAFTGIYFLALFGLLVVGTELSLFLLKNKEKFALYVATFGKRLTTFVAFTVVAVALIYLLAPQIVNSIFVSSGFQTTVAFAASIEELQAPTAPFLFASFGATLFVAPMSAMLYLSTFYPNFIDLFWIGAMAISLMYFFMDFDGVDDKKFLSGNAVLRFRANEALLVFIAYYAVTAYLQIHAVRFNSLLAIPLAIFAAYTVYWILLSQKVFSKTGLIALMAFSAVALFFFFSNLQLTGYVLTAATAIVVIAIGSFLYFLKNSTACMIVALVMLALLIGYIMITDTGYSVTLIQADNINPVFVSALNWMHNNTPTNSVVLSLWPDGSLIEGVANRTSVTDSVGSQNKTKADPFGAWIFNSSPDGAFLTGNINGRPSYLLVRYTWLLETSGIYTESGLNASNYNSTVVNNLLKNIYHVSKLSQLNASQLGNLNTYISQFYAYTPFSSYQENVNSTNQTYTFTSQSGFGAKVNINSVNGTQKVNSYLYEGSQSAPFKDVVFDDQVNGSYQVLSQNAYNQTNNDTLLITYSSVPKPGAYVNITNAYVMSAGIANSNMAKFLFECGVQYCNWDNNVATMSLVYANPDTKIFRIDYNSTAPITGPT
ncbi:MAG: STT3 domain-containing protein [Candidatus Micrarchaeales archaeon]